MKRVSRGIVVEAEFAVKSESAPKYFGISNIENPVFDRRVMDTDRPSQKSREDVPSGLSFQSQRLKPIRRPVVTRPSEGTRGTDLSYGHYRSRAREGRGISVAPEAQIEPEIETRPEPEIANCEEGLGAAGPPTIPTLLFYIR